MSEGEASKIPLVDISDIGKVKLVVPAKMAWGIIATIAAAATPLIVLTAYIATKISDVGRLSGDVDKLMVADQNIMKQSGQIERHLSDKIEAKAEKIGDKIDALGDRVSKSVESIKGELGTRIDASEARLDKKIDDSVRPFLPKPMSEDEIQRRNQIRDEQRKREEDMRNDIKAIRDAVKKPDGK